MIQWGLAQQPHSEEKESGDLHVVREFEGGVLVGVIDGLGHGPEAAAASRLCGMLLAEHARSPLSEIVAKCDKSLQGTRGAALSLALFDDGESAWKWLGIGNVAGVLVRADHAGRAKREFLVPRSGLVGARLPQLAVATMPALPGDTLILATDGIRSDFSDSLKWDGSPQEIADSTLARHGRGSDDALVLVARYVEV